MKPYARVLACVAALALAAPACVGHKGPRAAGALRAAFVVGDVTAQRADGTAHALRVGETIAAGESIRTGPGARVRLEAGGGRALEFGAATSSTITSKNAVALDSGSALAETGGVPWNFDARGTGVGISTGASRVELALGVLRVGVYGGGAHVDLVGRGVDIPPYHELEFAGGIPVERDPRLLSLSDNDPWDRRLLGDVLEFDRDIDQFGKGFDNQFAGDATDAVFYGSFVSVQKISSVTSCATSSTSASDELIGLVFAERLDRMDGSTYRVRTNFCSMLNERSDGGTWGLIAKERGLPLQPVLRAVLDSIKRGTTPQASGGGGSGGGGFGGGGGNPPRQPSPKSTRSPKPKPTQSPTPGPSPSPTPTPCGTLEKLLGLCGGSASTSGGTSGADAQPNCTIVDALLDPKC